MQAKAVNEFNKNVLLLARAGTGKTYTVAQKIVKAEQLGIEADKILCLTFTVKAAEELRNDILLYCGNFRPEVFTIHGFCYRLMREYGRKTGRFSDKQIADEIDDGEMINNDAVCVFGNYDSVGIHAERSYRVFVVCGAVYDFTFVKLICEVGEYN